MKDQRILMIAVEISDQAHEALKTLTQTGLYGKSFEETAGELLRAALRDQWLVEQGAFVDSGRER